MTASIFSIFLNKKGLSFETREVNSGTTVFIIHNYKVPHGKHSGKMVHIGLPIPHDFPQVKPYGFHIRKDHGFGGDVPATNPSDIGEEWEFWSREVDWDDDEYKTPQYYFDQVNRWLEGA